MPRSTPRFGAHMPAAGGLHRAFDAGRRVGCESLQLFVKNQRQWSAPPLTDGQVSSFRAARLQTGISPVIAHAGYLLNLASPDRTLRPKGERALLDELRRCETLGIDYLVFHPGSRMGSRESSAIRRVARALDRIHDQTPSFRAQILIETTAGQGTTIGHRFDQVGEIIESTNHPQRLGVCLDTCHLFVAGYDFRTAEGYRAMMDELEGAISVARVKCIHVNDSKGALGSNLDRHEHIGKGKIGKDGFAHFVNDQRFAGIPMILETPKGKDGRGADHDKLNLKKLRALVVRSSE